MNTRQFVIYNEGGVRLSIATDDLSQVAANTKPGDLIQEVSEDWETFRYKVVDGVLTLKTPEELQEVFCIR